MLDQESALSDEARDQPEPRACRIKNARSSRLPHLFVPFGTSVPMLRLENTRRSGSRATPPSAVRTHRLNAHADRHLGL